MESGGDGGAGGSSDQELRVAVRFVDVGAEVAAFIEEPLAVDGEHGMVRNPEWKVGARGSFGALGKSNEKWNVVTGRPKSIGKSPSESSRGKKVKCCTKGPVDIEAVQTG